MEFSRQEHWNSGLPFPSPGDLPNPGIKPMSLASPALAGRFFCHSATWEALRGRFYFLVCFLGGKGLFVWFGFYHWGRIILAHSRLNTRDSVLVKVQVPVFWDRKSRLEVLQEICLQIYQKFGQFPWCKHEHNVLFQTMTYDITEHRVEERSAQLAFISLRETVPAPYRIQRKV